METYFDITVIGGGPGGYVAAIRAAQLGYKVALIEKYATLGGTCTNVGCIPSKALLDSTEHFYNAGQHFQAHGIDIDSIKLNFPQLMARKNHVVKQNTDGLNFLMKKNKITVMRGVASFLSNTQLSVNLMEGTNTILDSKYFIIATGSKPSSLPGIEIDKKRIITSTEALALTELPKSIAIIGGGVIGVEIASIYARMGVSTTIIEYADSLIPVMDKELGKELNKILSKIGIRILLNHKVKSTQNTGQQVRILFDDDRGQAQELETEYCLVAVGRKPYTHGLGLENTGVKLDPKGKVITNDRLQTAISTIYAIGDVVAGPMLAHKAEEEGVFVAETINGQLPNIHYHMIPNVVYTWPEVASVGDTEEELKAKGISYRKGKFPFSASGRARAAMEQDGFVKVLADAKFGDILGVHIIGPRAADLIAQVVVAMEYEITDKALSSISYAHPTYSEALKEAYLMASGKGALNF